MKQIVNTLFADEGKILYRKADNTIYGKQIELGYTYYINGYPQNPPHKDVIDDFGEIDDNGDIITVLDSNKEFDLMAIEEENRIAALKTELIRKINEYDCSDEVNIFYYNDIPVWLDKATRVGLVNSTNMEKRLGYENTTLILNNMVVELPCDTVLTMLAQLEVYAKQCYNVTANHIINIQNSDDLEFLTHYAIHSNYPEKLHFTS